MIKFVRDLAQVGGFLRVLRFSPPKKKTDFSDITEILLKVVLNPMTPNPIQMNGWCIIVMVWEIYIGKVVHFFKESVRKISHGVI